LYGYIIILSYYYTIIRLYDYSLGRPMRELGLALWGGGWGQFLTHC